MFVINAVTKDDKLLKAQDDVEKEKLIKAIAERNKHLIILCDALANFTTVAKTTNVP